MHSSGISEWCINQGTSWEIFEGIVLAKNGVSAVCRYHVLLAFCSRHHPRMLCCTGADLFVNVLAEVCSSDYDRMVVLLDRYQRKREAKYRIRKSTTVTVINDILREGLVWGAERVPGVDGRVYDVPRDGDCFFHAVGFGLKKQGIPYPSRLGQHRDLALDLRQFAVTYLDQSDDEKMRTLRSQTHELTSKDGKPIPVAYDGYCSEMQKSGTFVEGAVRDVLGHALGVRFEISLPGGDSPIQAGPDSAHYCIRLYLEGLHYQFVEEEVGFAIANPLGRAETFLAAKARTAHTPDPPKAEL